MTDCNETLKELETFLDGELTEDAVAHIRGHLEGCLECYEAFDFHAELKTVIATKCKEEMPPGLMSRIEECLHADIDGDGKIG